MIPGVSKCVYAFTVIPLKIKAGFFWSGWGDGVGLGAGEEGNRPCSSRAGGRQRDRCGNKAESPQAPSRYWRRPPVNPHGRADRRQRQTHPRGSLSSDRGRAPNGRDRKINAAGAVGCSLSTGNLPHGSPPQTSNTHECSPATGTCVPQRPRLCLTRVKAGRGGTVSGERGGGSQRRCGGQRV